MNQYLINWCCDKRWAFWSACFQADSSFLLFAGRISNWYRVVSSTAGGFPALTRSYSFASIGWFCHTIIFFYKKSDKTLKRTKIKWVVMKLKLHLESELGERGKIFQKIGGLLGATTHLLLDHTVNLFLDSRVGIVVVDVRQRVDDFSVPWPGRIRWSLQHQNVAVIIATARHSGAKQLFFCLFTFLSFPFPLFPSEFVAAEFLSGRGGFLIFLFSSGYNRNKRFYQNGLGLKYQIE